MAAEDRPVRGPRHFVTFLVKIIVLKSSYLLTYLFTYLTCSKKMAVVVVVVVESTH